MWWLIGKVLGWIGGAAGKVLAGQRDIAIERERTTGTVGSELARTQGEIDKARASERTSYASAGYWWAVLMLLLPAFVTSMAASVHFAAVAWDSMAHEAWSVDRLPAPMDSWQGIILTTIVGGGGLAGMAMLFMRR